MGKKRGKKNKSCAVCGKEGAKAHPGGLACEACRQFFESSTLREPPFKCRKDGKCIISPSLEEDCDAGHYKKRLESRMNPSDPSAEGKSDLIEQFEDIQSLAKRYVKPLTTRGPSFISTVTENLGIKRFTQSLSSLDKITVLTIPPIGSWNLKLSLNEVLVDAKRCYVEKLSRKNPIDYPQMALDYCRTLTLYADFARGIHDFRKLNDAIKIKVTQRNYYDVAVLRIIFLYYRNHEKVQEQTRRVEQQDIPKPNHYSILLRVLLQFYNLHVFPLFERLVVKEEEVNLLRLIALFHPFADCTPICHDVIRCLHGKYIGLLAEYLNEEYDSLAEEERLRRLEELMSLLKQVKELSLIMNKWHTNHLVRSMSSLMGTLSFDLHIQDYNV